MKDGKFDPVIRHLCAVVFCALLLSHSAHKAHAQVLPGWPNEPAGATVVGDHNFDTLSGGGFTCSCNTVDIVQDSTAPMSPGSVGRWTFPMGFEAGISPGNLYIGLPGTTEVYTGFWWSPSVGFESQFAATKMAFVMSFHGQDSMAVVPTIGTHNGVFGPWPPVIYNPNTAQINNCQVSAPHYGDCPGTQNYFASGHPNNLLIEGGKWYLWEIYAKQSSSKTSADGILRVWLNGALMINITNWNTPQGGWNEFQINPTWGGTGSHYGDEGATGPGAFYYDHVHVSVGGQIPPPLDRPFEAPASSNTGGAGGGGGMVDITPPPPPPPEGCPPIPDMKIRTPQNSTPALNLGTACKNGYEIFGLPPVCSLSAGTYDAGRDTWDLESGDASGLTISCPDFCGKMEFTIIPKNDP
jgi:hypothetical protein